MMEGWLSFCMISISRLIFFKFSSSKSAFSTILTATLVLVNLWTPRRTTAKLPLPRYPGVSSQLPTLAKRLALDAVDILSPRSRSRPEVSKTLIWGQVIIGIEFGVEFVTLSTAGGSTFLAAVPSSFHFGGNSSSSRSRGRHGLLFVDGLKIF